MCSPFELFGEFGFRIAESLHCQELSQLREGLTDSQAVKLRPATSDTSVLKYLDQRQSTEATAPFTITDEGSPQRHGFASGAAVRSGP